MSMISWVLGMTPAQIDGVRAHPALAEVITRGNFRDPRLSLLGRWEAPLDLEKSWHILHYLFTGHVDASPAPGDTLVNGEAVGPNVGYGPARLHGPQATAAFAAFLAGQDADRLVQRIDIARMVGVGVYGLPVGAADDPTAAEGVAREVRSYFPPLRAYVDQMAAKEDGLLVWLA
jgi:hypothetical protein